MTATLTPVTARVWTRRIERHRRTLEQHPGPITMHDGERRTIGDHARRTSKPKKEALQLYRVIREHQPAVCLELGTSAGISGLYQAAALRVNEHGHLTTIEGKSELAAVAREGFAHLGLDATVIAGRFHEVLPGLLPELGAIDYAFVDGHHLEEWTLRYLEMLLPFSHPGTVLVFDDIDWSDGMRAAWARIREDDRLIGARDLGGMGLVLVR